MTYLQRTVVCLRKTFTFSAFSSFKQMHTYSANFQNQFKDLLSVLNCVLQNSKTALDDTSTQTARSSRYLNASHFSEKTDTVQLLPHHSQSPRNVIKTYSKFRIFFHLKYTVLTILKRPKANDVTTTIYQDVSISC